MTAKHLEYIRSEEQNSKIELAPSQPERLAPLAEHLLSSIAKKIEKIEETGSRIGVHDPDWCRENAEEAGKRTLSKQHMETHMHCQIKILSPTE